MYTVEEIAEKYRVTPNTVYRWITSGKLGHFKIGDNIRITEEQLQEFITKSSKKMSLTTSKTVT